MLSSYIRGHNEFRNKILLAYIRKKLKNSFCNLDTRKNVVNCFYSDLLTATSGSLLPNRNVDFLANYI